MAHWAIAAYERALGNTAATAINRIDCKCDGALDTGGGSETADKVCSRLMDSATSSGPDGRPDAVTAWTTADGEDELAGTGLSLVIDGFNHLQTPHGPCPPSNTQLSRSPALTPL